MGKDCADLAGYRSKLAAEKVYADSAGYRSKLAAGKVYADSAGRLMPTLRDTGQNLRGNGRF